MRVYVYGATTPVANHLIVAAQMRAGHDYYNQLVEAERRHRGEREVELRKDPRYYPAAFIDLRACYDDANSLPEGATFPAEMKARFRQAFAAMSAARKAAARLPAIAALLATADSRAVEAGKVLRAASSAEWGTRGVREAAMRAARKTGRDPHFRKYDGRGMIAVQLQKGQEPAGASGRKQNGLAISDLLACKDTRVRLSLAGPCPCFSCCSPHRKQKHAVLSLRVGSEGRAPIWADIPITMHRDLPAHARLKLVRLHRRVVGVSAKWEVQFVVDDERNERPAKTAGPTAAIDIGWRRIGDDLRVAWLVGEDGASEELRLPVALLSRKHKVEELRSIQDLSPATEIAADLARRRDLEARLGRPLTPVEQAKMRSRHLHQWEDHQRENVLRARREIYRVFAARIARTYRRVVIEEMDLRQFAVLPKTVSPPGVRIGGGEPDSPITAAAREWRFFAALSELRGCIRNAVEREGGEVVEANPAWTTLACFACGAGEDRIENAPRTLDVPALSVILRCSACGESWDQDENAARNLLRAVQRQPAPAPRSRPKREPGGVFRAKHAKSAKTKAAKTPPLAIGTAHARLHT